MDVSNNIHFRVKEKSFIARVAAYKLKASSIAIVIGKTIHLHNCSKQHFLANESWLKHELCHIKQFKEHGFIPFIFKYVVETIRKGYYMNKYEVEARAAESGEVHID